MKKEKHEDEKKRKEQDRAAQPAGQEAPEGLDDTGASAEAVEEQAIPMVMLPAEDVDRLRAEAKSNLESWQRERADFLNYKRRIERDQQTLDARITGDIIKKILPVVDDLERALSHKPEDGKAAGWAEGIDLIYRKLSNVLEAEGVTRIPAGEFDPNIHEAISLEASPDHKSGEIIEIVQQGYQLGDRVLRPAQVRVAQ